ncbi:hypothetical protein [Brachybacterium sp. GU-2]|uniref:hypothetical protein n=1 Tax=Brachybacterium sp. GU-2 TaxID=3069708 RepID=UPI00280AC879|nr:hypothetical protein [Brachybacterium sp. GU-2]WME24478.1 hypothetical protein RBL05_07205 [Brachybacterium sp. GU-2]
MAMKPIKLLEKIEVTALDRKATVEAKRRRLGSVMVLKNITKRVVRRQGRRMIPAVLVGGIESRRIAVLEKASFQTFRRLRYQTSLLAYNVLLTTEASTV